MAKGFKTGGRQRGTPNKLTASFREAIRLVYDEIGGHAVFAAWARENPGDFYKIAARLIPAEGVQGIGGVTVIVDPTCGGQIEISPPPVITSQLPRPQ